MTATDGDKDRPQNIVYFLTGQGIDPDNPANSKFDINRTSGEIFVLKVKRIELITRVVKFHLYQIVSSSLVRSLWTEISPTEDRNGDSPYSLKTKVARA